MLALYTRDAFTKSFRKIKFKYIQNLSADPIVTKMASNDIAALADTQQLISEIRLLKDRVKKYNGTY